MRARLPLALLAALGVHLLALVLASLYRPAPPTRRPRGEPDTRLVILPLELARPRQEEPSPATPASRPRPAIRAAAPSARPEHHPGSTSSGPCRRDPRGPRTSTPAVTFSGPPLAPRKEALSTSRRPANRRAANRRPVDRRPAVRPRAPSSRPSALLRMRRLDLSAPAGLSLGLGPEVKAAPAATGSRGANEAEQVKDRVDGWLADAQATKNVIDGRVYPYFIRLPLA